MENLFKKWLKGEVNWTKEKQLRQSAQSDPFLADAMEGYDAFPERDHAATIERLKKRLPTQAKKKNVGIFTLPRLAAAAAMTGIIATFFWLQTELNSPTVLAESAPTTTEKIKPIEKQNAPIASLEPQPQASTKPIDNQPVDNIPAKNKSLPTIAKNKTVATPIVASKPNARKQDSPIPPPAPIEQVANIETVETEAAVTISDATNAIVHREEAIVPPSPKVESTAFADEVESGIPTPNTKSSASTTARSAQGIPSPKAEEKKRSAISLIQGESKPVTYMGNVKNQKGEVLVDVLVSSLDTNNKTLTTMSGSFQLQADTPLDYLLVSKKGFQTRTISVNDYSNFLNVVLLPTAKTGATFSTIDEFSTSSTMTPRPKGGFLKFERYIDNNLIYPQEANEKGIEMEVEVRFYINEDGTPTDFETLGNEEYGFEEEAIRLIKAGPKWKPKKQKVTCIIEFKLD